MKKSEEREAGFRQELSELLAKYRAELDIVNEGLNYMPRMVVQITMMGEWDSEGNITAEYTEFNLL